MENKTFSNQETDKWWIDTGSPLLNLSVDGLVKIGAVAAARSAAEDGYYHVVTMSTKGIGSRPDFEHSLKKMCKEGAYWGTASGIYLGLEYGLEQVFEIKGRKKAILGGAITGAAMSLVSGQSMDKIVTSAITGGAIATAADFINHRYY